MKNNRIYLALLLISAAVICFEILSTRISSVIFVSNYAFIIISLAILGIGCGSIFSYYKIDIKENFQERISKYIFFIGLSLLFFILAVIVFKITNFVAYFILLFFPFFFAGIIYSQIFKNFPGLSFKLYAADLAGAALGSVGSIIIFNFLNAPNAILFLSIVMFFSAFTFSQLNKNKTRDAVLTTGFVITVILFMVYGKSDFVGKITIGKFDEKDFYYVYPDAENISTIIESEWSIYGRADLVEYSNQNIVKQLFIDGAAGSQMLRFNGDIKGQDQLLQDLLFQNSGSIPFLFLNDYEKNNMLVIGPGGGKEVLVGLLGGVGQITGVEVNPGFVNIVKKYKDFNGGIYTDFPNVKIEVEEGRHFIKKTDQRFDLIVMSLPSTEQLQSIDNIAANENYLLTVEALIDYLNILSSNGRLIFTIHNNWELVRLIITAVESFKQMGVSSKDALNHFVILEDDYTPTIVIKKNAFTTNEINRTVNIIKGLPHSLPSVTYLPYHLNEVANTPANRVLKLINNNPADLDSYINENKYNVTPCRDDSPYFYKVNKGITDDYLWLLIGVSVFNLLVVAISFASIRKKIHKNKTYPLILSLSVFIFIGFGFMILEVALFQKLILYLGSPTVSLSVLLSSILIGMGIGSYYGGKIFPDNPQKRLTVISFLIVLTGLILFVSYQPLLSMLMSYGQTYRSIVCFFLILPLGFLLGIPFPTGIQILKQNNMEKFIPWMYGVNGVLTVLGSITAVILSMTFGFNFTFITGLSVYFILFLILYKYPYNELKKSLT
ncbi:MAG: hypothetical protein A2068_12865 [Ignavibacteria bacterium GWB2_35_6b]|nr:MAG: hypothetical protein A2068_12865 [Ignavibacteria bacterium GWB2_35_6b]